MPSALDGVADGLQQELVGEGLFEQVGGAGAEQGREVVARGGGDEEEQRAHAGAEAQGAAALGGLGQGGDGEHGEEEGIGPVGGEGPLEVGVGADLEAAPVQRLARAAPAFRKPGVASGRVRGAAAWAKTSSAEANIGLPPK